MLFRSMAWVETPSWQHRKRVALFFHERLHEPQSLVDVHRQHENVAAILCALVQLLEMRQLRIAWPSPTGPNGDQDRLALQCLQGPGLACEVGQLESGHRYVRVLPLGIGNGHALNGRPLAPNDPGGY